MLGGDDADVIVVDMDSLYGPMSWLRLHAAGKRVIGLTAMERTQTDFRLARPIDPAALAGLLDQLSDASPAPELRIAPASPDPAPALPSSADAPASTPEAVEAVEAVAAALATREVLRNSRRFISWRDVTTVG